MGVKQCIAYHHTLVISHENNLFLQYDTAHTINNNGHFVPFKLNNIFMPLRTVVFSLEFVDTQIELCTVLYHRLVQ